MILKSGAVSRLAADKAGATTIEYALIIFIVSLAIGFLLPLMGASIQDVFNGITATINQGAAPAGG